MRQPKHSNPVVEITPTASAHLFFQKLTELAPHWWKLKNKRGKLILWMRDQDKNFFILSAPDYQSLLEKIQTEV